jgi:hypothetical protein
MLPSRLPVQLEIVLSQLTSEFELWSCLATVYLLKSAKWSVFARYLLVGLWQNRR